MRQRGVLIVFGKRPEPGRVKTRLVPPFTPAEAADLYRAMLADVLDASAAIAEQTGLDPILAVAPAEACAELAQGCPAAFRVVPQRGADLSARMEWAVSEAGAAGASPILLRGSDSPALDGDAIREALAALSGHDLVLCPDRDGGYALAALRRPAPGLFSHAMSTRTVLEDTRARADGLGLRSAVLAPRFDIDAAADLHRLEDLRGDPTAALCPRTFAYLDSNRLWPARG